MCILNEKLIVNGGIFHERGGPSSFYYTWLLDGKYILKHETFHVHLTWHKYYVKQLFY
jgi:hypothetical protein